MNENQKPLNLNTKLDNVDTNMPCLAPGVHPVKIAECEVVDSKNIEGQQNLKVKFVTTDECPSQVGDTLNPGFPVTRTIPLTESWLPDIVRLMEAALGKRPKDIATGIANLPGSDLLIRTTVRNTDDYGAQTEIKGFVAAA